MNTQYIGLLGTLRSIQAGKSSVLIQRKAVLLITAVVGHTLDQRAAGPRQIGNVCKPQPKAIRLISSCTLQAHESSMSDRRHNHQYQGVQSPQGTIVHSLELYVRHFA